MLDHNGRPAEGFIESLESTISELGTELSRFHKDAAEATEYVLAVENRLLRAEIEMLSKTVKQHEATLEEAKDMSFNAPELNMNNYDDNQVRELNDAMIAIWRLL